MYENTLSVRISMLKTYLKHKYGESIGEGRHRIAFAGKHCIIKMPVHFSTIRANHSEYNRFKNPRSDENGRLARCRLVNLFDIPVIVMEKVEPVRNCLEMPEWAWQFDCGQVGKDSRGNIKAYDYTNF
jgi:hypothetical protein